MELILRCLVTVSSFLLVSVYLCIGNGGGVFRKATTGRLSHKYLPLDDYLSFSAIFQNELFTRDETKIGAGG